jgi:hypothetical protein
VFIQLDIVFSSEDKFFAVLKSRSLPEKSYSCAFVCICVESQQRELAVHTEVGTSVCRLSLADRPTHVS